MNDDWKVDPDFLERKAETRQRAIDALFEVSSQTTECSSASESPIENLMFHALSLIEVPLFFNDMASHPTCQPTPTIIYPGTVINFERLNTTRDFVLLFQQFEIGKYRVDFMIYAKFEDRGPYKIVVECDGHDFHEKTKEQAERDKSRDRALALEGYTVLRFTGREIWRDAFGCASEVSRMLKKIQFEGMDL